VSATTEGYSVTRTLRALEALAAQPLSSSELAERIGVHPRTARRLLLRLAHEAYATPLGGYRNRYALTQRIVVVGAQAMRTTARRSRETR
jgi:DNA-binding IclR family transcriptional regulator